MSSNCRTGHPHIVQSNLHSSSKEKPVRAGGHLTGFSTGVLAQSGLGLIADPIMTLPHQTQMTTARSLMRNCICVYLYRISGVRCRIESTPPHKEGEHVLDLVWDENTYKEVKSAHMVAHSYDLVRVSPDFWLGYGVSTAGSFSGDI
jgi:hypothetical protein